MADRWEIDKKHLSLGESLGKGAFGQVLRATLSHGSARSLRTVSNSSSSSSSSSSSVAAPGSSTDVDAEETAKLLDFGIAADARSGSLTSSSPGG